MALHWNKEEIVYALPRELTAVSPEGECVMSEGKFLGFPAKEGIWHFAKNEGPEAAVFVIIGSNYKP